MRTLAMPLTLGPDGALLTLEQDSDSEVAQSVALLLSTRPGERRSVPGYGLPDPLGRGADIAQVTAAIADWEDRAGPGLVEELTTGVDQLIEIRPAAPADVDDEEVI